jgi:hypothetical protein
MLLPLQPHRKKISRILLIGLGIATPFLTAWILYNIININQYPLMQANMVIGTFAAYIITRDPQIDPGRQTPLGSVAGPVMIIFTIIICSCLVVPVLADDCASDPLNAQDCLRTDGYAEVMAGLIATILSVLINGPIIAQTFLQGATGAVTGVQPPGPSAPPQGPFVGDKTSFVDARGEHRTAVLQADGHWLTDQGTWYDPDYAALLAEGQKIDAANAAWRAANAAQEAKDAANFKAMTDGFKAKMNADQKALYDNSFNKWYKDFLKQDQANNEFRSGMYQAQGNLMDGAMKTADWVKYGCDKTIDVLGEVTGPVGKNIKMAYKMGTNLGEGLGEGMVDPKNLGSHLLKGGARGLADLAGDKLTDKAFEGAGKALEGWKIGKPLNWLNKPITVNPDPMAIKLFGSNKTEIGARALGNASKGWLKGWGPGYGVDAAKDFFIGKH